MTTAIIVAAGQGVRMGADQRKQFLNLSGQPILMRTLQTFDACEAVGHIVLVLPTDEIAFCRENIVDPVGMTTETSMVAGGTRRQDSVLNGLASIQAEKGIVLIHDGVRPLLSTELIQACVDGAKKWGACIPAVAPVDTPKQVDGDNVITQTIPRDHLRLAQTPQAFELRIIREAHQAAQHNGWQATDDASLVERLGLDVHVIPGMQENLKITTPADLAVAEAYLALRNSP